MASQFITAAAAKQLIGVNNIALLAPDEAVESGIDEARLSAVVEDVNSRIDSEISKRYDIPLPDEAIPGWLQTSASYLIFYQLAQTDSEVTELMSDRNNQALKDIRRIGSGEIKLKISDTDNTVNAGRTKQGRAFSVNDEGAGEAVNKRVFKRSLTAGMT
ncbi:DUF1320 domain-containing protein [Candidatus Persebacteraceae bacterium Df01]|jgi:phage gp36-like protein|uniref:DUF1320 domain-containing protein n=1 Tax=Candidatus Doriopsillibacter californiensis TaxID=2970740 RepID=A0ABT7QM47_9GAMM|nr:DUF1320 domain-containing protein [Candidatus Persebacteraceae bacterium Df01]